MHSLGTSYEIVVHLFQTGSTAEIGNDVVIISAFADVRALRKAIIHEFPETLKGREANKLVVTPTLHGAPLGPDEELWDAQFESAKGKLHAYVAVPPKPEGAAAGLPLAAAQIGHKRRRAQCYRELSFDPNFASDIPFEAHEPTTTRDNIISYLQKDHAEPRVISLFAPPGFGKTEAGVDAARLTGCGYVRVAFSRTGICLSLKRRYMEMINDQLPPEMTTESLLHALEPLSQSFVAHVLNHARDHPRSRAQAIELAKNGFSVFSQPELALADACKQLQYKIFLHVDEVSEFMVPSSFHRKMPKELVQRKEYSWYCLISLSTAIFEALTYCHQYLRVMFTGTTSTEAHLIKSTALKTAPVDAPQASTSDFVARVVGYFLDLSHLSPECVNQVYTELAGCKRSVQWFLSHIDSNCRDISGDNLNEEHLKKAVEFAREQFLAQAAGNLLRSWIIANDALLAFIFYQQYGGSLVKEKEQVIGISFPRHMIPKEWYLWNHSGAVHLQFSPNSTVGILQWPYPFMVTFLQRNAGIVASANKDLLRSFLFCCVAQPDTPCLVLPFQFAVARELTNYHSPLVSHILAKFGVALQATDMVPTVNLFTVPEDLPQAADLHNVFMVVDQYNSTSSYVDIAFPVLQVEGHTLVRKRVLVGSQAEARCRASLRKDCCVFFDKCSKNGNDHDLFVFLSYFPVMEFENSGGKKKYICAVQDYLQKPNFVLVEGSDAFTNCSFPFDKLTASAAVSDVCSFRKSLLSPLENFFSGDNEGKQDF